MRNRAFTLVEVLIGLTIFSLIAAGVYSGLYVGIKLWRQLERQESLEMTGVRALELVAGYARNTFCNRNNERILFSGESDTLNFFSVTAAGEVEESVFELEPAADSGFTLVRRYRPALVEQESTTDTEAFLSEPIHTKVREWKMSYYDPETAQWGSSWPENALPPAMLLIEAAFGDTDQPEQWLRLQKVVAIPVARQSSAAPSDQPETPDAPAETTVQDQSGTTTGPAE